MSSRIGPVLLSVGAERIGERIGPSAGREVRYRLFVPGSSAKELEALRELLSNPDAGPLLACLSGDVFFAEDVLYEDFGLRGDRRVVELDAAWVGTPSSHSPAYEVGLASVQNEWGI